jgi:hypothetical protein
MSNKHYLKYFAILEIDPDVPFSEVRSSYLHLRELYSNKSAVLSILMDQIYKDRQKEILNLLKDAYNNLKEYYAVETREKLSLTKDTVSQKRIPEFEVFSGNALRLIREVLEIELEEVALATGIPHKHLKNIELEEFDLLPPPGYIRAYVKKYSEYLFLDAEKVTEDFMKRFRNQGKKRSKHSF